jgi:hypothetical protein
MVATLTCRLLFLSRREYDRRRVQGSEAARRGWRQGLSLKKLKHKLLKLGKGFTVVVTASGAIGDELTLTVKHRCLQVGSTKPQKTC